MNIELLQKIATKLSRMRHKKHFNMDTIVDKTECGTAACIAGWVLLDAGYQADNCAMDGVTDKEGNEIQALVVAANLLQITEDQADRLFLGWKWPEQFGGRGIWQGDESDIYNNPKVAAKRIEHFIATKGEE